MPQQASPHIRDLRDLDGSQAAIAGGKGASLGELVAAGMRVPAGFVVLRSAFDAFLAAADPERRVAGWLTDVDAGRLEVDEAARSIDALLAEAPLPDEVVQAIEQAVGALGAERVSVRSSATCEDGAQSAWAGQLDTFLGVAPSDVVAQVKACWLSIFRPPALAYGAANGYGAGEFAVAAVVQQMVASEVAGIGFSVHPVTQEPDLRLIEACFGQGEAIVSGEIAPDQYVVERGARRVITNLRGQQRKALVLEAGDSAPHWRDLGERGGQAKLDEAQILEYAGLLDRIEAHYGHPVDTEWALADGAFHLLQARPITTLADEYREAVVDESEPWAPLVRRPLSLAELSLVAHWTDKAHMSDLGFHFDDFLAIQDMAGLATMFLPAARFEAALDHLVALDRNDRGRLVGLLRRGHEIFDEGMERVERGLSFDDPAEAEEYFIRVGTFTVTLPAWTLIAFDLQHIDDAEVWELAEGLRAHSIYPRVAHELIHPMVSRMTESLGFGSPERAHEVATWGELRRGVLDRATLDERLAELDAGRRFVLRISGDDVNVRFVSQTGYLFMRLAGQREVVPPDDPDRISGQAAWPGFHRGRARLVVSSDPTGYTIEDGDVLVSPQSNPNLMPLLKHAGAIVTDDGGVACHAGIICRELQIPTIIGTTRATSTIRDGDIVEVDATEQVVRIVERAGD